MINVWLSTPDGSPNSLHQMCLGIEDRLSLLVFDKDNSTDAGWEDPTTSQSFLGCYDTSVVTLRVSRGTRWLTDDPLERSQ